MARPSALMVAWFWELRQTILIGKSIKWQNVQTSSALANLVARVGQLDTHRGAQMPNGGRGVIALRSTAKNGSNSTVVLTLAPGAGVTVPSQDVDTIITENSVAELHRKCVKLSESGIKRKTSPLPAYGSNSKRMAVLLPSIMPWVFPSVAPYAVEDGTNTMQETTHTFGLVGEFKGRYAVEGNELQLEPAAGAAQDRPADLSEARHYLKASDENEDRYEKIEMGQRRCGGWHRDEQVWCIPPAHLP